MHCIFSIYKVLFLRTQAAILQTSSPLQTNSYAAETVELRRRCLAAGHDTAMQYRELLQNLLHLLSRPGAADARTALPPISRRIAACVAELVATAQLLKGTLFGGV
jgi:hypothetical protein